MFNGNKSGKQIGALKRPGGELSITNYFIFCFMRNFRWLKTIKSLGLEFWLPLPLLGLLFWMSSGLVTNYLLNRSYYHNEQLQFNTQIRQKPAKLVLAIKVEINYKLGISKVKVKTANSTLKQLEFEFFVTDFNQIEAAISRELGLSVEQVRQLVRYQINYS